MGRYVDYTRHIAHTAQDVWISHGACITCDVDTKCDVTLSICALQRPNYRCAHHPPIESQRVVYEVATKSRSLMSSRMWCVSMTPTTHRRRSMIVCVRSWNGGQSAIRTCAVSYLNHGIDSTERTSRYHPGCVGTCTRRTGSNG